MCPLGQTCRCREGQRCNFSCTGECDVECLAGSSCTVNCSAADCETICASNASCQVNCNLGQCDTTCAAGSSCGIECNLAQCSCSGPTCPF